MASGQAKSPKQSYGGWTAYLQLVRLPAVFTAPADIVAGFALRNSAVDTFDPLMRLIAASVCLYAAGMVFNDIFDRHQDAQERPGRPIPSGRVSLRAAAVWGAALLFGGMFCAASVGERSALTATALAGCVLLYDGWAKRTPVGPIVMGACRSLNVVLGASVLTSAAADAVSPQQDMLIVHAAAALGVYIAGLTWFARREAGASSPRQLLAATVVINAGIIGLIGYLIMSDPPHRQALVILLLLIAFPINRRLIAAVYDPRPELVQPAVGTMLQSLVMFDAVLVLAATQSPTAAAGTAALLIPAITLRRWIPMT